MKLSTTYRATAGEAKMLTIELATGRPVTQYNKDRLICHHLLTAKKKLPKTALEWVGLACNPKDIRQWTHAVHVQDCTPDVHPCGRLMVGSDGNRLHWAPAPELECGWYNAKTGIKRRDMDSVVMPDWYNLYKVNSGYKGLRPATHMKPEIHEMDGQGVGYTYFGQSCYGFNVNYLDQTFYTELRLPHDVLTMPCVGDSLYGKFMLMPMRCKMTSEMHQELEQIIETNKKLFAS